MATGYSSSAVASAAYTINLPAATPVLSPPAGAYTSAQSVTITDATAGETIYYTTNGAAPTTSSTRYTGGISVAATETIQAIAVAAGYSNSAVASAAYTSTCPQASRFLSGRGDLHVGAERDHHDATAGATIYYTTNGARPPLHQPGTPAGSLWLPPRPYRPSPWLPDTPTARWLLPHTPSTCPQPSPVSLRRGNLHGGAERDYDRCYCRRNHLLHHQRSLATTSSTRYRRDLCGCHRNHTGHRRSCRILQQRGGFCRLHHQPSAAKPSFSPPAETSR